MFTRKHKILMAVIAVIAVISLAVFQFLDDGGLVPGQQLPGEPGPRQEAVP